MVTPCTSYNDLHTFGSANCNECTGLYFKLSDASKSDFIQVRQRDGTFTPLVRPVPVQLKKKRGMESCQWCPQLQRCGHPSDWRLQCNKEGDPEAVENTGWVERKDCEQTPMMEREAYNRREERVNQELRDMPEGERAEYELNESKMLNDTFGTKDLEKLYLHVHDSTSRCLGVCVKSGKTACSDDTKKIITPMPPVEEGQQHEELTRQQRQAMADAGGSVPCAFDVPATSLTPLRAMGKFSLTSTEWLECRLIPCELV